MNESQRTMSLYLHCGIPVISLSLPWNEATHDRLGEIVDTLIGAGHCEIIVNLASPVGYLRRTESVVEEWCDDLLSLSKRVTARHGRLFVIANHFVPTLAGIFWAKSEGEAVQRLNGEGHERGGLRFATHLTALTT
ncbi:MAG: hypothetical protein H7308_09075 [Chthonomonadaceae bacterium]|nr:hypothetical protein [Chthonomonadaceae bacterium]